jgi:hypothetical protein
MSPALDPKTETRKQPTRKQSPQQEPDVTVKDDIRRSAVSNPSHNDIAALAYSYWLERGQPDGSPEEDWLRAERELAASR